MPTFARCLPTKGAPRPPSYVTLRGVSRHELKPYVLHQAAGAWLASLECSCGLTEGLSAPSGKDFRQRADKWIRDHAEAEEKRIPVYKPAATPGAAKKASSDEPAQVAVEHRALQSVTKSDGTYHSTRIGCSCGKKRAGWGYSKDESISLNQAEIGFSEHLRKVGLSKKEQRVERAIEGGFGLVLLAVAAVVVVVVVGLAVDVVGWFGDDPATDTTSELDDSGSGIDCDKAVSTLMESMYGSWGSGSWPDGEYSERVAQCKGE